MGEEKIKDTRKQEKCFFQQNQLDMKHTFVMKSWFKSSQPPVR